MEAQHLIYPASGVSLFTSLTCKMIDLTIIQAILAPMPTRLSFNIMGMVNVYSTQQNSKFDTTNPSSLWHLIIKPSMFKVLDLNLVSFLSVVDHLSNTEKDGFDSKMGHFSTSPHPYATDIQLTCMVNVSIQLIDPTTWILHQSVIFTLISLYPLSPPYLRVCTSLSIMGWN